MTDPQHAAGDEVLINPATGMPETREQRDEREEQLKDRQNQTNKNTK